MVQCLLCASSALSHLWWFMGSGRRFSRSRSWTYHVHGYISCCFFKARPIMSCLIYLRLMTSWQYGFESWNSTRFSCNYWFFGEKKLFSNVDFKTISFQFFLRYWWLFLISFIECNFLLSETMCNFSDYKLTKRKTFPYSAAYAHLLEWISCILLHFNVAYAWRPLPPRPLLPTAWRYYTTARRGLRFLRKVWNRVFFSSNFFLLGRWFSVFFFFERTRNRFWLLLIIPSFERKILFYQSICCFSKKYGTKSVSTMISWNFASLLLRIYTFFYFGKKVDFYYNYL